jgi:hypothetical protein
LFYERKDFTSHFFRQAIFLPAQKIIDGYAVPHSVNIKVNCMIHEILKNKSVVLASASPRRAQLFSLLGLKAEIYPADIAEPLTADPPDLQAITHARNKAAFTAERYGQQTLVVAADTVVAIAGQVLGKPRDVPRPGSICSFSLDVSTAFSLASVFVGEQRSFMPANARKFALMSLAGMISRPIWQLANPSTKPVLTGFKAMEPSSLPT